MLSIGRERYWFCALRLRASRSAALIAVGREAPLSSSLAALRAKISCAVLDRATAPAY